MAVELRRRELASHVDCSHSSPRDKLVGDEDTSRCSCPREAGDNGSNYSCPAAGRGEPPSLPRAGTTGMAGPLPGAYQLMGLCAICGGSTLVSVDAGVGFTLPAQLSNPASSTSRKDVKALHCTSVENQAVEKCMLACRTMAQDWSRWINDTAASDLVLSRPQEEYSLLLSRPQEGYTKLQFNYLQDSFTSEVTADIGEQFLPWLVSPAGYICEQSSKSETRYICGQPSKEGEAGYICEQPLEGEVLLSIVCQLLCAAEQLDETPKGVYTIIQSLIGGDRWGEVTKDSVEGRGSLLVLDQASLPGSNHFIGCCGESTFPRYLLSRKTEEQLSSLCSLTVKQLQRCLGQLSNYSQLSSAKGLLALCEERRALQSCELHMERCTTSANSAMWISQQVLEFIVKRQSDIMEFKSPFTKRKSPSHGSASRWAHGYATGARRAILLSEEDYSVESLSSDGEDDIFTGLSTVLERDVTITGSPPPPVPRQLNFCLHRGCYGNVDKPASMKAHSMSLDRKAMKKKKSKFVGTDKTVASCTVSESSRGSHSSPSAIPSSITTTRPVFSLQASRPLSSQPSPYPSPQPTLPSSPRLAASKGLKLTSSVSVAELRNSAKSREPKSPARAGWKSPWLGLRRSICQRSVSDCSFSRVSSYTTLPRSYSQDKARRRTVDNFPGDAFDAQKILEDSRAELQFDIEIPKEKASSFVHRWHFSQLPLYDKIQYVHKTTNSNNRHLSMGRKKFNMDPKKGIEYLTQQGILHNEPQDIATFLYKGEGLNKTAIGDYLGERNEFNIEVLKAFVNLHEFTDMILVQALRQFLWSFRLPGEAQKIDRMMECFADRYCQMNPGVFSTTDTCYVLSFAIIMLNTSLHNPAVKDKPDVSRFIAMNRGINDGANLPEDLLIDIYENIKKEPFKFPEDDGNDLMHTFFNPDKEGWLWKQGGRYKNWKRRWFILKDNCLYYFEYTTDKEPKGIIPLENIQLREVTDSKKPNCFEIYCSNNEVIKAAKTDSDGKVIEGRHTAYRMSAGTPEEKDGWMDFIRGSISEHPFYDMLSQRRKKAQMQSRK